MSASVGAVVVGRRTFDTRLSEDIGPIELERMQVIASNAVTHLRFRS